MSLFVRLETSFWTHRKTMRLRALIGDAALWLPPRLWCYAAQNQPDGDFSKYLPAEFAMILAYLGDAQALLEALQQAGFLDGMQIHGWPEHNGYHEVYAERAKKAANARWGNEKKRKERRGKGEEKRREEQAQSSIASSNAQASSFEEFWQSYPRRVGKADAERAFDKHDCAKLLPQILTAIRKCKISADWTKDAGQFIPHPATWLNRRGWDDELLPARNGNSIRENIKPHIE